MTQHYDENSYIKRYAEERGVWQFLLDKIEEIPHYQDLLVIDQSSLSRLRYTAKLDFDRFLQTLQKHAEKCYFEDRDKDLPKEEPGERIEVFWQIKEAGLQWTQKQQTKLTPQGGDNLPKAKTVFCPKITLKIIDRDALVSFLILKSKTPENTKYGLLLTKDFKIMREGCKEEIPLKNEVQRQACAELFATMPNSPISTDHIIDVCFAEKIEDLRDDNVIRAKRFNMIRKKFDRLNDKIAITFGLEKAFVIGRNESSRSY